MFTQNEKNAIVTSLQRLLDQSNSLACSQHEFVDITIKLEQFEGERSGIRACLHTLSTIHILEYIKQIKAEDIKSEEYDDE